jgi:photosystem II stability/assembly factor-like uncharacterized protein
MKKYYLLSALLLCLTLITNAQDWMRDMRDPRVNFYTVQKEFNAWWSANGKQLLTNTGYKPGERDEPWQLYKRWERKMMPLMKATHGVRLGAVNTNEKNFYQQRQALQSQRSAANWTYIGAPISFDDGGGDSSAGRVNCVRFDPVNSNVIYCGAPTGGVWKSTDFGANWQLLNTDNLPQIGVSDITINPANTNTIYIATGDIANSQCYSIGVLKSTDAGQTWNPTGLGFTTSQGILIARLLMSPLDSNMMIAATNIGIFKTIDGGNTWNNTDSVFGLTGMEFNPLNPNTVYCCGQQLYKSLDCGSTWNKLSNGLPDSLNSGGFAIGVTPADTTCVYVIVSDTMIPTQSYYPYLGLYRSLDGGNSFSLQSTTPDQTGTQGYYDLNVGVSAVNRDVIIVAAVDDDYSTDGGVTWSQPTFDSHVDHHDIRFFHNSTDTVFSADDGGLFISADGGNTWAGLNNGMHIGEIYNMSSSNQTGYLYLSGRQDEGTLYQDTSYEGIIFGGDGLECLVDPENQNNMYFSAEDGYIGFSNDGGNTINNLCSSFANSGINGPGVWNTPFLLEADNTQIIYVGKDSIYKSIDGGNTFNGLNTPPIDTSATDGLFQLLVVAPSNPNYIYAATYSSFFRSTDGGNTFTDITNGLSGYFTCLAVSNENPEEIWVGFYGDTATLLKSVDAGSHLTAYTSGLPSGTPFYGQWVAPVRNSKDAVYCSLANAGGVYYRDSTMSAWVPYSNGLPNVTVDQIEIDYCAGKIRAATYGRDLWESLPYIPFTTAPTAQASYISGEASCTDTVTFTDASTYSPTSWQWYFPGGQPSSSTLENPVVIYPNGSTYTATFIAGNAGGADTVKYTIPTHICTTGIDQVTESNTISVYPNPNNGNFVLSVTGQARGLVNMTVINNIGESVYGYAYTKDADQMTVDCSLSTLARGIYYVRVATGNTTTVQKLVIEN